MTKKSDARKFRDQQAAQQAQNLKDEGRKGWDEVEKISAACLTSLVIPLEFKDALKNHKLIAFLSQEERGDLEMKVRLLQTDLLRMLESIKPIRAEHAGRTGREADYDEVFKTYGLVEKYVAWQSEYDAFILPTKADIIQYLSDAEARQQAHTRQVLASYAAATDENPIEVYVKQYNGATVQEDKYGNPVPLGTKVRVIEEPVAA
jgi:hypothetical protein